MPVKLVSSQVMEHGSSFSARFLLGLLLARQKPANALRYTCLRTATVRALPVFPLVQPVPAAALALAVSAGLRCRPCRWRTSRPHCWRPRRQSQRPLSRATMAAPLLTLDAVAAPEEVMVADGSAAPEVRRRAAVPVPAHAAVDHDGRPAKRARKALQAAPAAASPTAGQDEGGRVSYSRAVVQTMAATVLLAVRLEASPPVLPEKEEERYDCDGSSSCGKRVSVFECGACDVACVFFILLIQFDRCTCIFSCYFSYVI